MDYDETDTGDIFADLGDTAVNIIRTLQGRSIYPTDQYGNLTTSTISGKDMLMFGGIILVVVLLLFRK